MPEKRQSQEIAKSFWIRVGRRGRGRVIRNTGGSYEHPKLMLKLMSKNNYNFTLKIFVFYLNLCLQYSYDWCCSNFRQAYR